MNSPKDNAGAAEPPGQERLVSAVAPPPDNQDELTGLPGLPKWRHVYLFVFGCFVLWVLLLLGLTVLYS